MTMAKFFVKDSYHMIGWRKGADTNVYLQLSFDKVKRKIGRIVFDNYHHIYLAKKKSFKIKKVEGFSISFNLLPYVDRLDILCNNKLYKITSDRALKKGSVIYREHSKFETQLFIGIKEFKKLPLVRLS